MPNKIVTTFLLTLTAVAFSSGERLAAVEIYAPPALDATRTRTQQWVSLRNVTAEDVLKQIDAVWSPLPPRPSGQQLLDAVVATFSLVDPQTKTFVDSCTLVDAPLVPPDGAFLNEGSLTPHYSANMRLFYARYLGQRKLYDEALRILDGIDPTEVVDPATYFYYKAVCQHQLLKKKEGLETINILLKNTEDVPARYSSVATLMQYDLEGLKEKSLNEVSRKMKDSERRLELARSGPRAQKVQAEIIEGLDEIIEKLEQEAAASASGGGSSGGNTNNPGGSPADDSRVKGDKAPGNVDKKKLANTGGWGNLDEKEQAKAKNRLNAMYPAHYQKQNEEYFKKLAKRKAKQE